MTCPPKFKNGQMSWPNMTLDECVNYCASRPSPCSFFTWFGNITSCTVFTVCPDIVAVLPSELPARTFEVNASAMQILSDTVAPSGIASSTNASTNATGGDAPQNNSSATPFNESTPASTSNDSEVGVADDTPSNASVSQPSANVSATNSSDSTADASGENGTL